MKIIKHATVKHNNGYNVEFQEAIDDDGLQTFLILAYALDGGLIGDLAYATMLVVELGISPELVSDEHKTCSIGFCSSEQKWYGWSHRAIYGLAVGDIVKEGDCAASTRWTSEYLEENPEAEKSLPAGFTAKTLEDCRRMAVAFASSVS
jgi:hypothetical protein